MELGFIIAAVFEAHCLYKRTSLCNRPRDSFKWMNNCGYKGGDIDTINGISSLMRCAEACFNSSDCNFFTFNNVVTSSSICSLKTVSDNSQIASNLGSICGIIEKRIPKLRSKRQQRNSIPSGRVLSASEISSLFGRQFQTGADGSYAFANQCNFPGANNLQTYFRDSAATIDSCVRLCEERRDICDHFIYVFGNCFLKKNPIEGVYTENMPEVDWTCGVMTNRPRSQQVPPQQAKPITNQSPPIPNFNNVEFMPSKCNNQLSTTTIQPDSSPTNDEATSNDETMDTQSTIAPDSPPNADDDSNDNSA